MYLVKRLRTWRKEVEDDVIKRIDARWNSFDGYVTDGPAKDRKEQDYYPLHDIYHLHLTVYLHNHGTLSIHLMEKRHIKELT